MSGRAIELARRGREAAEATDHVEQQAFASGRLAEVLAAAGRAAEAEEELARAWGLCARKGSTALAARLRTLAGAASPAELVE